MKRVFVAVDYYLPAYKAGGPIASVSRIVARLEGEAEFSIFTRDRDLGDTKPFPDQSRDAWTERPGARVFYASPERVNARGVLAAIREARPEVIYLNSVFSALTRAVLLLRRLGLLPGIDITVAPRGEFSLGALGLKRLKKKAYLSVARLLGLYREILWQASSEYEAADIRREIVGNPPVVVVAPDILELPAGATMVQRLPKEAGCARFVFLSRISPKKNLHRAIELLSEIRGEATFTIYGPKEDPAYWERCQAAIDALPPNVRVELAGPIPPERVPECLGREEFFLFPTLGENFGHVIAEALAAGLPCLLSDETPWLDLEPHGAGWAIPLDDGQRWREQIQACVDLNTDDYLAASLATHAYLSGRCRAAKGVEPNRLLFGLKDGAVAS